MRYLVQKVDETSDTVGPPVHEGPSRVEEMSSQRASPRLRRNGMRLLLQGPRLVKDGMA